MRRFLAIALLLCSPTWAAWYNASWSHRAEVEIDATYVDEAVPVIPVFLGALDSTWHTAVQADADDIIVTQSDGTTELDYYLVNYDAGSDIGCIMVNVDGYISTSNNVSIYVYAGNSGASAASTTSTFTSTGYVGVYFPGKSTNDATTGGRNLTAVNTPGTAAVAALEFDAATYDGSSSHHVYEGTPAVTAVPLTMETIAAPDTTTSGQRFIFSISNSASSTNYVAPYQSGTTAGMEIVGNFGSISRSTISTTLSASTYEYVSGTRNATSGTTWVYDNATSASNATAINALSGVNRTTIGGLNFSGGFAVKYDGAVAYAAISDEVRSADYVATMYDAWFTSAFRTYGATEAQPSGDTGYLEFTAAATSAGGGSTNWTSASNALTSLATAATADIPDGGLSYQLNLTDASAALTGLLDEITQIDIELIATGEDAGSEELVDANIQLIIGGSLSGNNKADLVSWTDTSQVTKTYTWKPANGDTMPTPAQVDASNFGISLQFYSQGGATALMSVYRARVRIYSQTPVPGSGFFQLNN